VKLCEVLGFVDSPRTDMPSYDELIKHPEYHTKAKRRKHGIVMMSPDEYIDRAVKGFQRVGGYSREDVMASRSMRLVDQYAEEMRQGAKFPTVVLDYSRGFDQEGLHRALAAQKLGIEEIPVMVVSLTPRRERGGKKAAW
jgi:hypothetical protein